MLHGETLAFPVMAAIHDTLIRSSYLSKLWLTICPEILVAEALCNLKVTVDSTGHEELFVL
jgi:hypothetical protein